MALNELSEIDITSTGDDFYEAIEKCKANWALMDASGPFSATTTLTAAQVAALETTPISLVAAPGSGLILEFISAIISFNYAANFTVTNADNKFVIQYDAGVDVSESIDMNTFLEGSADAIRWVLPAATTDTNLLAHVNDKLEIFNEGTGDVTGGTGSTVVVKIMYRVHATGL